MDRNTGAETLIGGFGVPNIEAIAYSPTNGKLYGADAGQFGEINTSTGAFSPIGSGFGTGNGALGSVSFTDVDGLHFDPVPGGLYGVHRRGNGNDGNNDVLFRINTTTGAYLPGVFPDYNGDSQPDDYLVIYAGEAIGRWDVDDLAIDPSNGKMYGAANNGGSNDELIEINRVNGAVTLVGNMGVFDIEGLSFDSNGELFGSSGTAGTPANTLFDINKSTGAATSIASLTEGTDYEGLACLTDGTNLITGTVFRDDDEDGLLDAGETGEAGITVRLFRDDNGNGQVDPGEPQIGTQPTNGVGYYEFEVSSAGDFVIMVFAGDLPNGSSFTTDDVETASFPLGTFGGVDPNNDFGYTTPPPPPGSLSISKTSNGTGPLPVGFTLTYTITITNTGGTEQTGIAVRDTLPPDVTYVPGSTQVTLPGASNDTFRDEFNNQNYSGNNGSVNWSAPWSEVSDDGSATGGNVQVLQDGANPAYGVRIDKKDRGLERTADLSSYDTATLTFQYRSDDAGDELELFVNGALITIFTGGQASYVSSGSINLDSYTGGNATVRLFSKKIGGPKAFWIDDVEITASNSGGTTIPGNAPPLLTSGQKLSPGEQMTVTLQATVDANPSSCALVNTAWVSSNETPSQNATRVDLVDEGSGCSLPVELTRFDVQLDGRDALLSWQTASETNNAGFEIQQFSKNEGPSPSWHALDFVEGYGTTLEAQTYHYRVAQLTPGRHVFRLKQIDYDGTFEYHPEIEVLVEMVEQFVVEPAYPNPFNPEAQLRFAVSRQQAVQVVLYDLLGRRMQVLYDGVVQAGQMQVVRIDGRGLPSGLYVVQVVGEAFAKTQTVTLLK